MAAASTHATVESFSARRKTYMPTAMAENRMTSVATQAARSGRTTNKTGQGVERAGVEVGHERRAAEDVLVPEGQLAVTQHGADEDVEGVILLQVVAR